MKIVLNIECNGSIKEGDTLVYHNGKWVATRKENYLNPLIQENIQLKKKLEELQETITNFKIAVNNVLKEHHEVLRTITKEYD